MVKKLFLDVKKLIRKLQKSLVANEYIKKGENLQKKFNNKETWKWDMLISFF